MSKAKTPKPSKEEIDALRRRGKTRQEIADHFGISVAKLKRLITSMSVVPRATKAEDMRHAPKQRVREKPVFANPEEGEGLMDKAKVILGSRLSEKYGCYYLDGRPTSSWAVLKAAGLSARE
ncbi:transcriptional regulator [Microcystis phage Mwe-JY26]